MAKKTAAKAASTKKPAKKATAKKANTNKKTPATKARAILPTIRASSAKGSTRRPTPNPPLSDDNLKLIVNAFTSVRMMLEEASANIRALDRSRLNGVGIKKQGFIENTIESAAASPQFLPPYLDMDKFQDDFQYFVNLKTIYEMVVQLKEFIWNLVTQSADVSYTDALEYYASVREAAKRRIDGAESIYRFLEPFFKRMGTRSENGEKPETQKQQLRDAKAFIKGRRDGKLVIENIRPKTTVGVHKVIDERFTNSDQFKETVDGEIKE